MPRNSWIPEQTRATRALVKFIRDHDDQPPPELLLCLACLEASDVAGAVTHAQLVKPHGMGGVTDWWPPAKFPGEDPDYVISVLIGLVNEWCRLMALSFEPSQAGSNNSFKVTPDGAPQFNR